MSLDWRGRVYGMCRFNYQREDRVRSLFLRLKAEPLGEEGFDYLLLHAAGCWGEKAGGGDARTTDKVSFDDASMRGLHGRIRTGCAYA